MIFRLRQLADDYDKRSAHYGEFIEDPADELNARILCAAYAAVSMALSEVANTIARDYEEAA